MFSDGSFAKVWKVEKVEGKNYYVAEMSTGKKGDDGKYVNDWRDGKVRLVGDAAKKAATINVGDSVKIGRCGVTNSYDKEKKVMYTNYTIFNFEDNNQNSSRPATSAKQSSPNNFVNVPDESLDEELPFN